MIIRSRYLLVPLLLASSLVHAQATSPLSPLTSPNPSEQESFLVTLTLKTSDHDKPISDQKFTVAVLTKAGNSNVREGDRIPIVTGTYGGDPKTASQSSQVQYIDLGTHIDVNNAKRINGLVAVDIKVEMSGVAPESSGKDDPIIRQHAYSISPAVPLGKQITVYSSTDSVTGHKAEIQILVQPIPAA